MLKFHLNVWSPDTLIHPIIRYNRKASTIYIFNFLIGDDIIDLQFGMTSSLISEWNVYKVVKLIFSQKQEAKHLVLIWLALEIIIIINISNWFYKVKFLWLRQSTSGDCPLKWDYVCSFWKVASSSCSSAFHISYNLFILSGLCTL